MLLAAMGRNKRRTAQTSACEEGKVLKVAAIVPAHNEAERIRPVLTAIREASLVDELVVVNDGSTDGTSAAASEVESVRVIDLPRNRGKAGAMRAGAESTDADIVLFLDADLIGLTGELVDSLVRPVVDGETDVCIGIFSGGRRMTDLAQVIAPFISGQRVLYRSIFLDIPDIEHVRSGIEVAMTKYFRAHGIKMSTVSLPGCTHVMKEEKLGYFRGTFARLRMYYDICKMTLFGHRMSRGRRRVVQGLKRFVGKGQDM
jgi:glycosyltransferase involved in cell wall biosynthesis